MDRTPAFTMGYNESRTSVASDLSFKDADSPRAKTPPSQDHSSTLRQVNELKQRNKDMHRLFPKLDPSEVCFADFSCAFARGILRHGRMYITHATVLFYSPIGDIRLLYPLQDIDKITCCRNFGLPNSLVLHVNQQEHFFTSFVFRDKAFRTLEMVKAAFELEECSEEPKEAPIIESPKNVKDFIQSKWEEYRDTYYEYGIKALVEPVLILCCLCAILLLLTSLKQLFDVQRMARQYHQLLHGQVLDHLKSSHREL
ncbi:hypothetical protein EDD86DRAFT_206624 [Gorgonomyces haynaldii]|nr:hypothetical protein EDD86DRAFT_206624 [Gorgonomyces haynaldii]